MFVFHREIDPYAVMWHYWMGWVDYLNACYGGRCGESDGHSMDMVVGLNEGKEEDTRRVYN